MDYYAAIGSKTPVPHPLRTPLHVPTCIVINKLCLTCYLLPVVAEGPSIVKGYAVHIVYLCAAVTLSTAVSIMYMVVGEELKGARWLT